MYVRHQRLPVFCRAVLPCEACAVLATVCRLRSAGCSKALTSTPCGQKSCTVGFGLHDVAALILVGCRWRPAMNCGEAGVIRAWNYDRVERQLLSPPKKPLSLSDMFHVIESDAEQLRWICIDFVRELSFLRKLSFGQRSNYITRRSIASSYEPLGRFN